jgi:hypothetical protein
MAYGDFGGDDTKDVTKKSGTAGSDNLYTPSGRASMLRKRNRMRDLGAYD